MVEHSTLKSMIKGLNPATTGTGREKLVKTFIFLKFNFCKNFCLYLYILRLDTQYNDTQQNDTHHNDTQHSNNSNVTFSIMTFSIMAEFCYAVSTWGKRFVIVFFFIVQGDQKIGIKSTKILEKVAKTVTELKSARERERDRERETETDRQTDRQTERAYYEESKRHDAKLATLCN